MLVVVHQNQLKIRKKCCTRQALPQWLTIKLALQKTIILNCIQLKTSNKYRFWTYINVLSTLCDLMSVCTCSAASSVLARIKTPVDSFSRLWQKCNCDPACMPSVIFASKGRHSAMQFLMPSTSIRMEQAN